MFSNFHFKSDRTALMLWFRALVACWIFYIFIFFIFITQPVKTIKSVSGWVSFCWIGIQYAVLFRPKVHSSIVAICWETILLFWFHRMSFFHLDDPNVETNLHDVGGSSRRAWSDERWISRSRNTMEYDQVCLSIYILQITKVTTVICWSWNNYILVGFVLELVVAVLFSIVLFV